MTEWFIWKLEVLFVFFLFNCLDVGDLLMQLNRQADAERVWRQLLDRNPENLMYYQKLEECLGLSGFECPFCFIAFFRRVFK